MIPFPLTFGKNTFFCEQVIRNGQIAIYKQRLRPGAGCLAFEVIIIRKKEESVMFGKTVEAHEIGPSNEEFGRWGFSYNSLERAKTKFHALVAAAELPAKPKKTSKT